MCITLAILTAATFGVSADDNSVPPDIDTAGVVDTAAPATTAVAIDPTLAFFSALASCTPGSYTEKNILSEDVGQANLKQQIIGFSNDKSTCNAVLTTPDNRVLTCAFPVFMLQQLNDQHFLEGMLEGTTDSPSRNALDADLLWSNLKANSCSLGS